MCIMKPIMISKIPCSKRKAEKLKAVIIERKIIQYRMADDIGMAPQALSDILSGRLKGWKYRHRISQYLGVPEETLFPDDVEQSSCQAHSEQSQ